MEASVGRGLPTRIRITRPPFLTMACHCTGCQRMAASAFSLSVAVPSEGFAVTAGEPVLGGMRAEHRQFHCPSCLGWVFTRPAGLEWLVNVRATMLDDHRWYVPFIEAWTSEKLPWATTPAVHSYESLPPEEDYAALMEAFARTGARPA